MENTKPFIKLFKTPLGFYCYDVNTFSMLRITKEMYEMLSGITKDYKDETLERIQNLANKGYLSKHRPKVIKHSYIDVLDEYLAHNIRKITLQVTQNCNLACRYCAYANPIEGKQRKHSNKEMSLDIAKRSVEFLFKHSKNLDVVNVGFYGGEPLLKFDLIKEIMNYAKLKARLYNKKISFSITTNATLINEEIIEFLSQFDVHVMISIDGPQKIHDKNRILRGKDGGSFNVVINSINLIKSKYPCFINRISIHSVLDPENDFTCYNEFFMCYDDIKDIAQSTTLVNIINLSEKFTPREIFSQKYLYERFKLLLALLDVIDIEDVSVIVKSHIANIEKISESLKDDIIMTDSTHHSGPCIAGSSRLFVDVNGEFFPCERCSEKSEVMKIGNINQGFNLDAIYRITNIGEISQEECKNCWNLKHCSICAVKADNIYEFDKKQKLKSCEASRNIARNSFLEFLCLQEFGYDSNRIKK